MAWLTIIVAVIVIAVLCLLCFCENLAVRGIFAVLLGGILGWVIYRFSGLNGAPDDVILGGGSMKYRLDKSQHKILGNNQLDDELIAALQGKEFIIQHYSPRAEKTTILHRELLPNAPRQEYKRRQFEFKRALHWGQLKLMLTEIEFLTMATRLANDRHINFVYAGAAPGHHIGYLSKMFPKITMHLYDPNKFAVKLPADIQESPDIQEHQQFFTDKDAKYWAGRAEDGEFIAFASDVRTEPASDENVKQNMGMQLKWWQSMNPHLAMFKFRLPWEKGRTRYPKGRIYIQPFVGPTSTETRLIVEQGAPLVEYDNQKYEQQCFYHNNLARKLRYESPLGDNLDLQRDMMDNCYDCTAALVILKDYLKLMGKDAKELKNLLKDMQQKITDEKGIYQRSVKHFNDMLDRLRPYYLKPCKSGCRICKKPDGAKRAISKYKEKSCATQAALEEAIRKAS